MKSRLRARNGDIELVGNLSNLAKCAVQRSLGALNHRRVRRAPSPDTNTIRILLHQAYGMGGTIRTTLNLASYLALTRDVEIVSVIRESKKPFFPIPQGVRISFLDDRTGRPGLLARLLSRFPSRLVPKQEEAYKEITLWTDLCVLRYLRSLRGGVLIATRPAYTLTTALFAPNEVLTVGQEHVALQAHEPEMRHLIHRRYGRFDAFVTLTEADREHYAAFLADDTPDLLARIPNALSPLPGEISTLREKTAVSIGRIVPAKGFDRLVTAWKQVAVAYPDWILRIYGDGDGVPEREQLLRDQIAAAGLTGKVLLMGASRQIGQELAKASLYVVSSRYEGFGMTILEAMSKGVPVVSFDCPLGPREIITHEYDGLLVASNKPADLAAGISRLIADESLRHTLSTNALETVSHYDISTIGAQWDALLADLNSPTVRPSSRRSGSGAVSPGHPRRR